MTLTLIEGDTMTICSVPDCDRDARAKGMCRLHYERRRVNGTIEPKRFQDPHAGTPNKTCRVCMEVKPRTEFRWHGKTADRLNNECRTCRNTLQRERYAASEATREKAAWANRKSRYGLGQAEFHALLAAQGGACPICKTQTPGRRGWDVDHDHDNGAVRGILCHACNIFIGIAGEDVARLAAAMAYLTKPPAQMLSEETAV